MSFHPHHESLKADEQSDLQRIFSKGNMHSSEGMYFAKDPADPHPGVSATPNCEDPLMTLLCGKKRSSDCCLGQNQANKFKPNCARSRLSSTPEDNLQAKNGLNQTGFCSSATDYAPLNSLASLLAPGKIRDRTISTASESTIFSNVGTKQKCHQCQRNSQPTSQFWTPQQTLSPNYVQGGCLNCSSRNLNKETFISPSFSLFSGSKETSADVSEFKLDSFKPTDMKKKDSNSSDTYDGFLSADVTESPPVRMPGVFSSSNLAFKPKLNKREAKLEMNKTRTMSYDVHSNKVICCCCGKQEYSVLPIENSQEFNETHLCNRCSTALEKKQQYAESFKGTAKISTKSKNLVEYTCELGHSWSVNIHRAYKSWCSTCRKLLREEKKKQFRRQSSNIRRENERKQRELFNEAQSLSGSESNFETMIGSYAFEDLFQSILPVAKAKADNFISLPSSKSCSYEQALSVYKMLELDESRAKFILERMSKDSKKQGYKKLAIALHPDKNRHPLSKEAFQKASELFNDSP